MPMTHTTVRRDKATIERQSRLTAAFLTKMHRMWHQVRKIEVCDRLNCEHPWAP